MNLFFKIFTCIWIILTLWVGILCPMPTTRNGETIRNMFYHVPMWFCMMFFFLLSVIYAIRYLNSNNNLKYDIYALCYAQMGTLLGIFGLITGMVWAKIMWGAPWNNDPKQVGAAIALLGYVAYFILRRALSENEIRKAKISAVYNIFAFFMLFPTLWILPKMSESLHPGGLNDDNIAFKAENLTLVMRSIFWILAIPAWFLLTYWISQLYIRYYKLKYGVK